MRLRWFSLGVLAIAIAALGFGQAPGRHTTKPYDDCTWAPAIVPSTEYHFAHEGTCESPIYGPREANGPLGGLHRAEVQREVMREACVERIEELTRSSVGVPTLGVFAVVALGALLVAIFPRRSLVGAWIVASASATLMAAVASIRPILRPEETIALWPRYATWSLALVLALSLLGVTLWLALTHDRSKT